MKCNAFERIQAGICGNPFVGWCVVLMFGIAGCSGNPNLATVTGKVTLDDQPLAKAAVQFIPESGGAASFGKTDPNGNYRMQFSDSEAGAWIGTSRVEIRTGDILPDNSGSIPERVPSIYNSQTSLTAEVKSGTNTFDFALKSKASKIEAVKADQ